MHMIERGRCGDFGLTTGSNVFFYLFNKMGDFPPPLTKKNKKG